MTDLYRISGSAATRSSRSMAVVQGWRRADVADERTSGCGLTSTRMSQWTSVPPVAGLSGAGPARLTVSVRRVKSDDEILEVVRQDLRLADLLCEVCEFDLTRGDHGEPVRLPSGQALDGIAGDFTGGTFFLCGEHRSTRPVLYASSEGQAGLIGQNLAEALEIMIGLPSWWDCLKFSGGGDLTIMQSAADHLQRDQFRDQPEIAAQRIQLARAMSLDLAIVPVLLARLCAAVASTKPDFVLTVETGEEYESLFGERLPSRNPSWR